MKDFSAVFNAHPQFIDALYRNWQADPTSVEADWQAFFKGFDFALQRGDGLSGEGGVSADLRKELAVAALIHGFRTRGHLLSTTNPLKPRKDRQARLDLADYGLGEADLDQRFAAGFELGLPNATLRELVAHLHKIYAGNIGFEYQQVQDQAQKAWLTDKIENRNLADDYGYALPKKQRITERLNKAVVFEQFLHTKFVGQKRFSLEGGEVLIPALDAIIRAASVFVRDSEAEVVIGMAHRGRLNVLANTLGKPVEQIFSEFEGRLLLDPSFGSGDVKYHLGYASVQTGEPPHSVRVKMLPNPSHLEAIDPVIAGFSRARFEKSEKSSANGHDAVVPVLIHGDAALAGQGIVYELIQMSQLEGYTTGGAIHLVVNNQVGFTTSWEEGRSSTYSTQVADVVKAPVFHVNGDDPEAVVFAVELAAEYRHVFKSDVFVDIVCYRKYGHNESDEPRFTQPDLYALINKHPNPRDVYMETLLRRGEVQEAQIKAMDAEARAFLQERLEIARANTEPYQPGDADYKAHALHFETDDAAFQHSPDTGIAQKDLEHLLQHLLHLPAGFTAMPQIVKTLEGQRKLVEEGQIDWALGELLAYGALLLEGKDVRLSGQDVKRGTFSHRHACPMDTVTFQRINRLDGLSKDQGRFYVYNSPLSEYAVLGFEYGYSLAKLDSLTIWEAQFGDFANGAGTLIDQFILSAETKWRQMNNLTMLLPHGYEGQGPEHSSARLERFLQGCANNNITVANITSASNFFHLLRRQLARPFRKPLVVMSPKSGLRAPYNLGQISELTSGNGFRELIDDPTAKPAKVKSLLVCSGKVYYDLLKRQQESGREDVAIVRLEQLYPFPKVQFEEILKKYGKATLTWVQEEPRNMGAFGYLLLQHGEYGWRYAGRPANSSTATGFPKRHEQEQTALVDQAFAK
jgi:2-oxoglutarate dehydrogenase E1 component